MLRMYYILFTERLDLVKTTYKKVILTGSFKDYFRQTIDHSEAGCLARMIGSQCCEEQIMLTDLDITLKSNFMIDNLDYVIWSIMNMNLY